MFIVLIFIITIGISNCDIVTPINCPQTTSCTPLSSCRLVHDLMDRSCLHVGRLQELTCGYLKSEIMVCCPDGGKLSPFRPGHQGAPSQVIEGVTGDEPSECGKPQISGWQTNSTGLGAHPWAVRIGFNRKDYGLIYSCGGSLISPTTVLTTAECATRMPHGRSITLVQVGEYDTKSEPDCSGTVCADKVQIIPIKSITSHPEYDSSAHTINNVAIITLKAPVTLSLGAQPICLQDPSYVPPIGAKAIVVGFGKIHSIGSFKTTLQMIEMTIVDSQLCPTNDTGVQGTKRQLCVRNNDKKGPCDRFEGTPIVTLEPVLRDRFIQVGIVSSPVDADRCGEPGIPTSVVNIQNYYTWIQDNMQ